MGDGLLKLLSLILSISLNKNGIVLIDEIENGLHHSIMEKTWDIIISHAKKNNCQVIATTHSYECIKAANDGISAENTEDFKYIRLDRTNNKIQPKYFNHNTLLTAIQNNWEVR